MLVVEGDRRSEQLAQLVRDLAGDLRRHDIEVQPATRPAQPGERAGEVPLLGQIVLTFLTAGAAKALIDCLKAYVARDRSLQFKLKRADGSELSLDAKNLDAKVIDEGIKVVKRFIGQ